MFKRILFAHNATPAAERALIYLEHLAQVEEAEVIVLHVYESPNRYVAMQGYQHLIESLESVAREVVDDTVEYLRDIEIEAVGRIETGDPAPAILEIAREEGVSLIVLGTRGPSKVSDILLGNVSTEVLRGASCPVFLVP